MFLACLWDVFVMFVGCFRNVFGMFWNEFRPKSDKQGFHERASNTKGSTSGLFQESVRGCVSNTSKVARHST